MPQFHEEITKRKKILNISNKDLSDSIGLSRVSIWSIEKGNSVKLHHAIAIAKILGIDLNTIDLPSGTKYKYQIPRGSTK